MKVYILIDRYPYYSETFIYNQFIELLRQGINARMIYLNHSGNKVDHGVVKAIDKSGKIMELLHGFRLDLVLNIFRFPVQSFYLFKYYSFKKSLFYILNLKTFVDINNSDVLHTHFGRVGEVAAKLYKANIFSKVKLVNSFHGVDITPCRLNLYQEEYINLFKYSSLLFVNSPYSLNLLKSINFSVFSKTVILPVGVDQNLFFKFHDSKISSEFSIVYIGRLIRLKGSIIALKIAKKLTLSIPNFKIHIIGDGDELSMLLKFVEKESLKNYVVFHGALSQEKIKSILCESSIFVAPGITDPETGRAETQGLVIQEAQSMGLPVIVSDAGGMKYGLIDGESGFVVPEGDIDQFCDKVLFFYQNPSEIISFGEKGRSYVKKNFLNSPLTERLIANYKSL